MYAAIQLGDGQRSQERLLVERVAVLRLGDMVEEIAIEDLTTGGCRFRCARQLPMFEMVSIGIAGVGHTAARLAWHAGSYYGCAFEKPLPDTAVTASAPLNVARIAEFAGQLQPDMGDIEIEYERLSLRSRVAIIAGLSAALWSGIIATIGTAVSRLG